MKNFFILTRMMIKSSTVFIEFSHFFLSWSKADFIKYVWGFLNLEDYKLIDYAFYDSVSFFLEKIVVIFEKIKTLICTLNYRAFLLNSKIL